MQHSEQLNELASALAAAQGEFKAVPKDATNPHLKNKYATLDAIIATTRSALSKNGLSFTQLLSTAEQGEKEVLTTLLLHESGQWLSATVGIDVPDVHKGINDLQAFGSSLTYMKRYALGAMLGIATDQDDDGEHGTRKSATTTTRAKKKARVTDPWKDMGAWIKGLGRDGEEAKAILKEKHGKKLVIEDIPKYRATLAAHYKANPMPTAEELLGKGDGTPPDNDAPPPSIPF
jgi:cellobiose-specific phosphotransferase system component IIA